MQNLSNRTQLTVATALVLLLITTRGHHFVTIKHLLPSASWAVFFLGGVYLRPAWAFAAFLGITAALDFAAVTWGGVSNFCVSPAYVGLLPAYGVLWLGGRWYRKRHRFQWSTLLPLVSSTAVAAIVCEVISSGSFYFYSGRIVDPTIIGFLPQLVKYFPHNINAMAFWIGVMALIHTSAASRKTADNNAAA